MKNKTAAVVVTYNRKELLRTTINKLLAQEEASCDILIINNASNDGTEEMIKDEFWQDNILYFNTGVNLGGAGGFEFGVGRAVELGYEYVWIMDDDTWPNKNALVELIKADRKLNGNWGFLSSASYWTDGSICKANRQKKSIFRFVKDEEYINELVPILMGSFVSLLVKSEVIKEIGLPIGDYFIWTDDYEFCGRICKAMMCSGYLVTGSKVVHMMKNHTKAKISRDSIERIERYHYLYRNDVHCYRKYGVKGYIYIALKDIYSVIDILFYSKNYKLRRILTICKGVAEGITFNPSILMVNSRD